MSVPIPPRWLRRGLIDPLWLPVVVVLEACLLTVIAISATVVFLTPRARVLRLAAAAAVYLAVDARLVLGCFGIWLRHPTRGRDDEIWAAAHCRMLRGALDRLEHTAAALLGYQVDARVDAAVLTGDRPLIALARHAGPGDSFTLVRLLLALMHRRPRVVLKDVLQWDPGLDVVLNRLRACFIPSGSASGGSRATLRDYAGSLHDRDALLLFPEGANWTPRRHRRAVLGLLRAGRPWAARRAEQQPRVLPPRPAGTLACLGARPDADVLLAAHTGLDTLTSPRAVWQALPLRDRPLRVRLRYYPAAEVPRDPHGAQEWLQGQWSAMHTWITARDRTTNETQATPTAH
jgi:1-acyl-sn-glycerol-3-phosphate acyltransferase